MSEFGDWRVDYEPDPRDQNNSNLTQIELDDNYMRLAAMGFSHNECVLWSRYMLRPEEHSIIMLGGRVCGRMRQMSMIHDEISIAPCGKIVRVTSPGCAFCECRSGPDQLIYFHETLPLGEDDAR